LVATALLENVCNSTDLLRANGLDPYILISHLEKILKEAANLEKLDKEVEEHQENLLQTMADKVDATRAFVDSFEDFSHCCWA
jgi:hypothetical protein